LGTTLRVFNSQTEAAIVGVVADMPSVTPASPSRPAIFFSSALFPGWRVRLVVRSPRTPPRLDEIRARLRAVDPVASVDQPEPLSRGVALATELPRIATALILAIGALGAALAGLGLYAVLAYITSLRAREIGVRLALGANPAAVFRRTLVHGLTVTSAGIGAGLLGALALANALERLLYGTHPGDPVAFWAPALATLVLSLLACIGPARRASRVDPALVLRS
jgi:cell division protein FtsX